MASKEPVSNKAREPESQRAREPESQRASKQQGQSQKNDALTGCQQIDSGLTADRQRIDSGLTADRQRIDSGSTADHQRTVSGRLPPEMEVHSTIAERTWGASVANPPQRGQQLLCHDRLGTKWSGSWATRYIGDTDSNSNGLRQTSKQDWTSNLHKE